MESRAEIEVGPNGFKRVASRAGGRERGAPVGLFADRTRASDPSERRLTLVVHLKAENTYGRRSA